MQDFIAKLNDLLTTAEAEQIPPYSSPSAVHYRWIYRLRKIMEEHSGAKVEDRQQPGS